MSAHDLLDRLSCLIGVVEGDSRDIVVKNMGLNNTMKKLSTDETKFTINCGCSTSSIGPGFSCVVRKRWVGVLKECDGN